MNYYKVKYDIKTNRFTVLGVADPTTSPERIIKNFESNVLFLTDFELAKINKKNLIIPDNVTIL